MTKKVFIFFAICIGIVHVANIYLMPNCTYRPCSKKIHSLSVILEDSPDVDTASETAYKVKYRSLFSFNTYKKLIFSPGKPIAFINSNIRLNLIGSLPVFSVGKSCSDPNSLLTLPDIIISHCCLLI